MHLHHISSAATWVAACQSAATESLSGPPPHMAMAAHAIAGRASRATLHQQTAQVKSEHPTTRQWLCRFGMNMSPSVVVLSSHDQSKKHPVQIVICCIDCTTVEIAR